jgi:hypothetical protein
MFKNLSDGAWSRDGGPCLNGFVEIKKELNTKNNAELRPAPEALFWDAQEKCPKERTPSRHRSRTAPASPISVNQTW